MITIGPDLVHQRLPYALLVERLRMAFQAPLEVPDRHHHTIPVPDAPDATLLLMPAWKGGTYLGIKIATIFPGNAAQRMPAVQATYLLLSGQTGQPLALIDGQALTLRRTAATSALAASYLARPDSTTMLMVGAGKLAPHLIRAHATVRPIRTVLIWNRTPAAAHRLADTLQDQPFTVRAVTALDEACRAADLISCATLSKTPLVHATHVSSGTHVDLVGAYTPEMRETDTALIAAASVFCDTLEGTLHEAGDLIIPLREGALTTSHILGGLHDLTSGKHPGRKNPDEITVFKSVGHAIEDLVGAVAVYRQEPGSPQG